MRKLLVAIAAVVALGIAIYGLWPDRDDRAQHATATPAPAPSAGTSSTAPSATGREAPSLDATPRDPPRVRKLSREARAELGRQIAAARAKARASASGASAPAKELKFEDVARSVQQSFFDALPLLAECYPDRQGFRAAARMTLTSDPELGTVIDTEAIKDGDDRPVEPELETCLRDVIDSLGLPPLGDVGGALKIEYTFSSD